MRSAIWIFRLNLAKAKAVCQCPCSEKVDLNLVCWLRSPSTCLVGSGLCGLACQGSAQRLGEFPCIGILNGVYKRGLNPRTFLPFDETFRPSFLPFPLHFLHTSSHPLLIPSKQNQGPRSGRYWGRTVGSPFICHCYIYSYKGISINNYMKLAGNPMVLKHPWELTPMATPSPSFYFPQARGFTLHLFQTMEVYIHI